MIVRVLKFEELDYWRVERWLSLCVNRDEREREREGGLKTGMKGYGMIPNSQSFQIQKLEPVHSLRLDQLLELLLATVGLLCFVQ